MSQKYINVESSLYEANDFAAEIVTVPDTTDTFDSTSQRYGKVPNMPAYEYAYWGDDNKLPYKVRDLIGSDEVTAQNKLTNILTCYAAGVRFVDLKTQEKCTDPAIKRWLFAQFLPKYIIDQITSIKYYYFAVSVIILSKDGSKINRIIHKDSASCRFEKADKYGRVRTAFFADWENSPQSVEAVPLLNEIDPLGDLERIMGRAPYADGKTKPMSKKRKFAIVVRFPTVTNPYYPEPYYTSIFKGGSYDEKRLISASKRAKLRNSSSVKYLIEVSRDYWINIFRSENINDPEAQKARVRKEKENMKNFALGLKNSGKAWVTGFYITPDGKEMHDVKISLVEGGKEGGDWADEMTAATNTLCYADNVHPNLVGAVPGKSGINNSGSDKRELFVMKQSLETATHDLLLWPLQLVCYYNGWDNIEPQIPMIQLTTLDEHRDAKKVTV